MKATLEKFRENIEGSIPLGRIGTPEDVGKLAQTVYLGTESLLTSLTRGRVCG
jgi:hypothetical protein